MNDFRVIPIEQQQKIWATAIAKGKLPYDVLGNAGLNFIIKEYNGGKVPRGLGRTTLTAKVDEMYDDQLNRKKQFVLLLKDQIAKSIPCGDMASRVFAVQHDCWGSIIASTFLGIVISFIFKCPLRGWIFSKLTIGCIPFDKSHTAAATLHLTEESLVTFGIQLDDLSASTQDNASNAFNVFQDVDNVAQLPCIAHTVQLFLMHTIETVIVIDEGMEAIHDCVVALRGCNSNTRREELARICALKQFKFKTLLLYCKTRWNSREAMILRYIYLLDIIADFNSDIISDRASR
jgi:hypothetical protein